MVRRPYFRCTANDCQAKKRVDKLLDAPHDSKPLAVLCIGQHNHQPRRKPRLTPSPLAAGGAEDGCGLLPGLVLPKDDPVSRAEGCDPPAQVDAHSGCEAAARGPSGSGPKEKLFLDMAELRAEDIAAAMYRDLRRQLVH